ncbi:MAG: DUF885 domain-containing protein [Oscillospiraceae bacterium]|nr:DUF885 domain-containing protein [Oscillospiraceae bacterium]
MTKKFRLGRFSVALIVLTLLLTLIAACDNVPAFDDIVESPEPVIQDEALRFDRFLDELFAEWVSADTLTMNFFLAYPEEMGIERPEPTFGEIISTDPAQREISREESRAQAEEFFTFEYELLREDQRIIHAIIQRNIRLNEYISLEDEFIFYTGYIRPLTGIQIQLPFLLVEFSFYTVDDIERYLSLLEDIERYFDDIIEFERERASRGFFLNDANVDSVIEHLESFLENREDNFMITVFDDRINEHDELTAAQRKNYKQRNRDLVLNNVLTAYETLLSAMRELRGSAVFSGGLASLPGGEELAIAMLQQRAGTDRTAQELRELYEEWIARVLSDIIFAITEYPWLNEFLTDGVSVNVGDGTPESFIVVLQKAMIKDFPQIEPTQHVILEVHESLQDFMSPAFYLLPAIDNFDHNVIYINPASLSDELFLFTVIAHEGYPGHLYQSVYFRQQFPHPVRSMLSNIGYVEGWATYVEMISYSMAGIDPIVADLMWNLRLYDLLIQAYIDLGVNVLGWNHDMVAQTLMGFNISDTGVINNIYNMVTGVPLFAVPYSLGYIEMLELLTHAQDTLGNNFNLKEFHRFILDIGPTPFQIIATHMETWMARQG